MTNFKKRIFLSALIALLLPATQVWADGQVVSVKGRAQIDRGNDPVEARPGNPVFARDALRTDAASAIAIQMADDAILSLGSEGVLEIQSFRQPNFQGSNDNDPGEAIYRQRSSTLRVVTGLISQMDPQAQRIESDYAVIVAHGTDIESTICGADCVASGKGERGQYVGVRAGAISVSNAKGSVDAGTGEWVFIAPGAAPKLVARRPFTRDERGWMDREDSLPDRADDPPRIEEPPPGDPVVSPS